MKKMLTVNLCLAVFLGCTCNRPMVAGKHRMLLSKNEIFSVAIKEAKRFGFNVEEMILLDPDDVSQWRNYYQTVYGGHQALPKSFSSSWRKEMESIPGLQNQLKGKDYVAVYFGPKQPMLGGDLWVFIDRKNGKILTHLKGK